MADVIFGKTEVDAVSQELVSSIVQGFLVQEAKLLGLVSDFSSIAGPGMDKIKIPKAGGFTVGDKAENTAVDAQAITYTTDDLNLDKHKVIQVLAEDFATLQAKVNAVQDMAERAGKGLALQIDTDIITALEATIAAAPDHRIVYTNSAGANTLGKEDILEARTLLNKQFVPLADRYLGISPDSEKALLSLSDFIHAEKYGDANSLKEGEIGRIYGFTVIMHGGFNTAKTLAWHKSHVAIAIQQALRFQAQPELAHLGVRYSFDQVYGVKTLDAGKRGVLLGTAT